MPASSVILRWTTRIRQRGADPISWAVEQRMRGPIMSGGLGSVDFRICFRGTAQSENSVPLQDRVRERFCLEPPRSNGADPFPD